MVTGNTGGIACKEIPMEMVNWYLGLTGAMVSGSAWGIGYKEGPKVNGQWLLGIVEANSGRKYQWHWLQGNDKGNGFKGFSKDNDCKETPRTRSIRC